MLFDNVLRGGESYQLSVGRALVSSLNQIAQMAGDHRTPEDSRNHSPESKRRTEIIFREQRISQFTFRTRSTHINLVHPLALLIVSITIHHLPTTPHSIFRFSLQQLVLHKTSDYLRHPQVDYLRHPQVARLTVATLLSADRESPTRRRDATQLSATAVVAGRDHLCQSSS